MSPPTNKFPILPKKWASEATGSPLGRKKRQGGSPARGASWPAQLEEQRGVIGGCPSGPGDKINWNLGKFTTRPTEKLRENATYRGLPVVKSKLLLAHHHPSVIDTADRWEEKENLQQRLEKHWLFVLYGKIRGRAQIEESKWGKMQWWKTLEARSLNDGDRWWAEPDNQYVKNVPRL